MRSWRWFKVSLAVRLTVSLVVNYSNNLPYMKIAVNYQEYGQEVTGVVELTGRIKLRLFSSV